MNSIDLNNQAQSGQEHMNQAAVSKEDQNNREKKKRREDKLIEMLLTLDASDNISEIIDNHWIKMWIKIEGLRFSEESKEAYDTLRRILKYNLIGKRDGGIINQLIDDDGKLVCSQEEVNEQLARTLKEIQIDETWGWIKKTNFPKLPRLDEIQIEQIVDLLTTGKAVAYDTDSMFKATRDRQGLPKSQNYCKIEKLMETGTR